MEIALFSAKEKGRMKKLSFFHTSFFIVLTVMNCGFCPGSLEGLSACLLLQLVHLLAEPALLDGIVGNKLLSAHALDFDDVNTADHCLDLLVDGDIVGRAYHGVCEMTSSGSPDSLSLSLFLSTAMMTTGCLLACMRSFCSACCFSRRLPMK